MRCELFLIYFGLFYGRIEIVLNEMVNIGMVFVLVFDVFVEVIGV